MRHLSNALTISRMLLSVSLFALTGQRVAFLWVYVACGITDWLDGLLARRLHAQSRLGATLDSVADNVWFAGAAVALLRWLPAPPPWAWATLALVMAVRIAGIAVSWARYGRPLFLHTVANKAAGLLFFLCPLEVAILGTVYGPLVLIAVALIASAEELALQCASSSPDPDVKGWVWRAR